MTVVDDWEVEYNQLSDDYRFFIQQSWQSTVAVLAVDGFLVGGILQLKPNFFLGFLPLAASILTLVMAIQVRRWHLRWFERLTLLGRYDRAKGFQRFHSQAGSPHSDLGVIFHVFNFAVGVGLFVFSLWLFITPFVRI
jgi:hypothetical protein